jgi:hypothetical protein
MIAPQPDPDPVLDRRLDELIDAYSAYYDDFSAVVAALKAGQRRFAERNRKWITERGWIA